jgi:hypothetical protein
VALPTSRVLVVLDREYGDRLREVPLGQPVWIELSPTNEPVVRAIWATSDAPDHLTSISAWTFNPANTAEYLFLSELGTIEEHHGTYSTDNPCTEIDVVGCPLTNEIQTALQELGFAEFEKRHDGFVARRSAEEAEIQR